MFLCRRIGYVYDENMELARQGHIQYPFRDILSTDFGGRSVSCVSYTIRRSILSLASLLVLPGQNDRDGVVRGA